MRPHVQGVDGNNPTDAAAEAAAFSARIAERADSIRRHPHFAARAADDPAVTSCAAFLEYAHTIGISRAELAALFEPPPDPDASLDAHADDMIADAAARARRPAPRRLSFQVPGRSASIRAPRSASPRAAPGTRHSSDPDLTRNPSGARTHSDHQPTLRF